MADPARPRAGARAGKARPWWLAIGSEEPRVSEQCPSVPCVAPITSVDLYCPDEGHGDFLLFQDRPTGRRRVVAINTIRGVVVALALLAASRDTIWPIYLIAVAAGAALIGLLLHATQLGKRVGWGTWLVVAATACVVELAAPEGAALRGVWTVAVGVPLLAALFIGCTGAVYESQSEDLGLTAGIAVPVVSGTFAVLTWWLTGGPHADRFVGVPDALSRWCLFAGLGAGLAAALYAAVVAFVASFDDMDTHVDDLLERPQRRRVERPRRGDLGQVAWRFRMLRVRTANAVLTFVFRLQVAAVRIGNWVNRRLRLAGRRMRYVIVTGSSIFAVGVGHAARGLRYAWRPALAYVALIAAAVLAVALSGEITLYLVDGPLAALGAGVGLSVLAVAVCFAATERLSSEATRDVARAQFRLIDRATLDLAIFVVAVGWVVGIPGSLGYGPIRVGWATVVGTIVLAAVTAFDLGRARRVAPPAPG